MSAVNGRSAIYRAAIVAATLALLPATRAEAGAVGVSCLHPLVFPDAAVNVVFLPYRYAGDSPAVTETSVRLSALAQLDTLFSIVKYGSVGAVQLVVNAPSDEAECTADVVARKLLGLQPGAAERLAPGHSAVLAWGRFYEVAGQTYVQTYVRIIARDVAIDAIDVTIADRRFKGHLSSTGFAFAPRLVTRAELDQIQQQAASALKVYDRPSTTSRATPMKVDSSAPIVYLVTKVQGDWMEIQAAASGPSGWVRGDTPIGEWSLRRKLPEFIFIEGIVGFLKARSEPGRADSAARRAAISALDKTLGTFNEAKIQIRSPAPLALAVGKQMLGWLQLGPEAGADQLKRAETAFFDAASLVPYSADAINLHLMARLLLDTKLAPTIPDARFFVDSWTGALAREPGNADAVDNLQTFLEWLDADASRETHTFTGGPTADEVRKRLDATRGISRSRAGGH